MNRFMVRFLVAGFFLLVPGLLFARQIVIGSGSGAVVKNDMAGLKKGDTLAIRAGSYDAGGSFSHLRGITIINYHGKVQFSHSISFGDLTDLLFTGSGETGTEAGFYFHDIQGDAVAFQGPCRRLTIAQCAFRHVGGSAYDASHLFATYTGDSATFALYQVRFTRQHLAHTGPLFTGSFASAPHFENVCDSVSFTHVRVDSTESEGPQVLAYSMYHMLVSDWTVKGPAPNAHRDFGLIQTMGNGTVRDFYRHDGFGYIWRNWNAGLNGRGESWLYNVIDLSSNAYGTIDTRIEAEDSTAGNRIPFVRGGNMHIFNNTSGNKREPRYVSVLAVVGAFLSEAGYKVEVRNNLCFNTVTDNANPIIKQNTTDPLTDTSNNIYVKDPIAAGLLLDTIECRLNPKGAAVNGGIEVSPVTVDFAGIHRPVGAAPDIGARECPEPAAAAIRPGKAGSVSVPETFPWKRILLAGGLFLLVTGGLWFTARKAFRKSKGRSTLSPRELNSRGRF